MGGVWEIKFKWPGNISKLDGAKADCMVYKLKTVDT